MRKNLDVINPSKSKHRSYNEVEESYAEFRLK